ncbi:hypothetical protein HDU88_003441 [Geranomyces variabilis]|nr:hypothetical protein HDU88_003441 [Geranomyces variabilis]
MYTSHVICVLAGCLLIPVRASIGDLFFNRGIKANLFIYSFNVTGAAYGQADDLNCSVTSTVPAGSKTNVVKLSSIVFRGQYDSKVGDFLCSFASDTELPLLNGTLSVSTPQKSIHESWVFFGSPFRKIAKRPVRKASPGMMNSEPSADGTDFDTPVPSVQDTSSFCKDSKQARKALIDVAWMQLNAYMTKSVFTKTQSRFLDCLQTCGTSRSGA